MNDSDVKRIRQAVFQLINTRSAEESARNILNKVSEEVRKLEFEVIPELMHELGVTRIELEGIDVAIKQYYRASIPEAKRQAAMQWLRDNDWGDLIKREIRTKFGRGQDKLASKLIKFLGQNGWAYDDHEQVNHMTLTAWVKEQTQKGNANIPMELLGAHIGERVVLKVEGDENGQRANQES